MSSSTRALRKRLGVERDEKARVLEYYENRINSLKILNRIGHSTCLRMIIRTSFHMEIGFGGFGFH